MYKLVFPLTQLLKMIFVVKIIDKHEHLCICVVRRL